MLAHGSISVHVSQNDGCGDEFAAATEWLERWADSHHFLLGTLSEVHASGQDATLLVAHDGHAAGEVAPGSILAVLVSVGTKTLLSSIDPYSAAAGQPAGSSERAIAQELARALREELQRRGGLPERPLSINGNERDVELFLDALGPLDRVAHLPLRSQVLVLDDGVLQQLEGTEERCLRAPREGDVREVAELCREFDLDIPLPPALVDRNKTTEDYLPFAETLVARSHPAGRRLLMWWPEDSETPPGCSGTAAEFRVRAFADGALCVRLSHVLTRSAFRGKRVGAKCVAAMLRSLAKEDGVRRAYLFSDPNDPAPSGLYAKLGFKPIEECALCIVKLSPSA